MFGNWKEFSFGISVPWVITLVMGFIWLGIHLAGHKSLEITLSLKLTLSPLKIGRDPKGKDPLPTIHFQVQCLTNPTRWIPDPVLNVVIRFGCV